MRNSIYFNLIRLDPKKFTHNPIMSGIRIPAVIFSKLRKIQIFFTDFCFWSKREDVLHFLRISELYLPVCLANTEKYNADFFHGILFKTTRLNFWKRHRRQPSNKDKIATFMVEAEIIIKSWNPKMAKNQVSHFLVTGKKEPPNLVSLPYSVLVLFNTCFCTNELILFSL